MELLLTFDGVYIVFDGVFLSFGPSSIPVFRVFETPALWVSHVQTAIWSV